MTLYEFLDTLRRLHCIDRWQIDDLSDDQAGQFLENPAYYLMRCSDSQAEAIWRAMEADRARMTRKQPSSAVRHVYIERRTREGYTVERMGPYEAGSADAADALARQSRIANLHNDARRGYGQGMQLVYEVSEDRP